MYRTYIKYFFIIICSIYIYHKLFKIKSFRKNIFQDIIFAVLCSGIACFTRYNLALATLSTIVFFMVLFFKLVYKKNINSTISYTIISLGISFFFYYLSTAILSPFLYVIFTNSKNNNILDFITIFIIGLLQNVLIVFLFKIRRFKCGLPGLDNLLSGDIGVFVATLLLITASLFYIERGTNTLFIVLYSFSIICGLIIFLWWRSHIKNSYFEKINKRDIENMEKNIVGLQAEIDRLKEQNSRLAKIIHKDNKLIPAMELAVKDFISSGRSVTSDDNDIASSIINQLEALSSERKGIINCYENANQVLPQTGEASVDAIIRYLKLRADEKNVHFNFSANCNIKHLVSDIISDNDLNTLIADLGENALIAASSQEKPYVLITIGVEGANYCISFFDNGAYFDDKVLKHLGKKQYTTHADEGGSGIGMLTAFELLRRYNASFELNEFIHSEEFTKKISVYFDGAGNSRIYHRAGISKDTHDNPSSI